MLYKFAGNNSNLTIFRTVMSDMSKSRSESSEKEVRAESDNGKNVENKDQQMIVPDSKVQLRACLECGLIKSKKQWEKEKQCQNCGTFMRIDPSQNTTSKFSGLISLINPKASFIRKRVKIYAKHGRKLKSGVYGF